MRDFLFETLVEYIAGVLVTGTVAGGAYLWRRRRRSGRRVTGHTGRVRAAGLPERSPAPASSRDRADSRRCVVSSARRQDESS